MTKFQQELLDWLRASPDNHISTCKYWGYMGIHHTFRRAFGFKGDATPILPKTWEAIFPYMDCASYTPHKGVTLSKWIFRQELTTHEETDQAAGSHPEVDG